MRGAPTWPEDSCDPPSPQVSRAYRLGVPSPCAETPPSFPRNVVNTLENKGFDAIRGLRAARAKTSTNRPRIRLPGVVTPTVPPPQYGPNAALSYTPIVWY